MKGGTSTGFSIVCNGCFTGDEEGHFPVIFYRSEGRYGRIDWCYTCAKARLPEGWEPEVVLLPIVTGFIDHVQEILKRRKEPAQQLPLFTT